MEWTAEAIEQLRAFWAEGHSTAEIGRRMAVSKNAVVGKAHRLNLPPRPSPIRRDGEAAAAATTRRASTLPRPLLPMRRLDDGPVAGPAPVAVATANPAAPPAIPFPAPQPAPSPVSVLRHFPVDQRPRPTTRSCCWPIGEPGTPQFRFCGDAAMASKPYCAEHAAVAYVKARDRREDAA